MYESDSVSMLTTQIAILESQIEVRQKTIEHLRSEISRKDILIKNLADASAYKMIKHELLDNSKPYGEDAGNLG